MGGTEFALTTTLPEQAYHGTVLHVGLCSIRMYMSTLREKDYFLSMLGVVVVVVVVVFVSAATREYISTFKRL